MNSHQVGVDIIVFHVSLVCESVPIGSDLKLGGFILSGKNMKPSSDQVVHPCVLWEDVKGFRVAGSQSDSSGAMRLMEAGNSVYMERDHIDRRKLASQGCNPEIT
jgi:hypothetical protein